MPFPPSSRRLVLRDPSGARIVLDAREAVIRIYGPPPDNDLLYELDADQDFFGSPIVVQKIYDDSGVLRTQMSGLQLFIAGNDGRVEMKAGSSGTDNSQAQLTMLPAGATADGRIKGQAEPDNGASTTIDSPRYSTHDQSQIVLYAESDVAPRRIAIVSDTVEVTNALDVAGHIDAGSLETLTTLVVGTDLVVGDDVNATGDVSGAQGLFGDVVVSDDLTVSGDTALGAVVTVDGVSATGAWQTYTPAWTASAGAPTIGNGILSGRYREVGRTFDIEIRLVAGTTTTFGTAGAFWSFGAPVAFSAAAGHFVGAWRSTDAGTQEYSGTCCMDNATDTIQLFRDVGRFTNTSPFTFGNTDSLTITIRAESDA